MGDELIIPVRLDPGKAKVGLADLGQSARKTTGDVSQGFDRSRNSLGYFTGAAKQADQAVHGIGGAAKAAGSELAGLMKAQMGLGAIKGLAAGIGAEWRAVADDIGKASREWMAFRKNLSGVASLSGKPATNAFASAEVDAAEKAGVKPEDFKKLRESFLSKASAHIGAGENAKLSEADAAEFQQALAAYGQTKGIDAGLMGEFGGGLITQAKGKQTAAGMKRQAGAVLAQLEASSTDVKQLLPQQIRVQAQGLQAEDAAAVLASAPEYAPGEESTHVLQAIAAMRDLQLKGNGDEFGLKKGGDEFQNLRALVANLQKRAAAGEDMDKVLDEVAPERVGQRAFRGMLNQGGRENLDRWRKIASETPDDLIDTTVKAHRGTETGRDEAIESAAAVEDARLGLRGEAIERRRQIARIEATKGGLREHVQYGQLPAGLLPGADGMEDRIVNQQAIRRLRGELGESSGLGDALASTNKGMTNDLMRELMDRLDKQHEQQAQTNKLLGEQNRMIADDARANANRPLVAPPPMPRGR